MYLLVISGIRNFVLGCLVGCSFKFNCLLKGSGTRSVMPFVGVFLKGPYFFLGDLILFKLYTICLKIE